MRPLALLALLASPACLFDEKADIFQCNGTMGGAAGSSGCGSGHRCVYAPACEGYAGGQTGLCIPQTCSTSADCAIRDCFQGHCGCRSAGDCPDCDTLTGKCGNGLCQPLHTDLPGPSKRLELLFDPPNANGQPYGAKLDFNVSGWNANCQGGPQANPDEPCGQILARVLPPSDPCNMPMGGGSSLPPNLKGVGQAVGPPLVLNFGACLPQAGPRDIEIIFVRNNLPNGGGVQVLGAPDGGLGQVLQPVCPRAPDAGIPSGC
jgi:hypothetical protein